MKLKTLCERVKSDVVWAESNPNMSDMPYGSNHYRVTLRYKGHRMTVPFSCGPAICEEPTAEDVLDCLLSDYSTADQPFEDWARDLGFDEDSRKAERIYKAVERQSDKLRVFLGADLETFLHAER